MKVKMLILFLLVGIFTYGETIKDGMNYFKNGEYEKSELIFRKEIKKTPFLYNLYPYLIGSFFEQKKYDDALFYLDKLEKNKSYHARKYINYETYTKIYIEKADYETALKKCKIGLKNTKDILQKNNLIGLKYFILVKLGRFDEAVNEIQKERKWNENPMLLYYLGKIYILNKDLDQGIKYLSEGYKKAIEKENTPIREIIVEYFLDAVKQLESSGDKIIFLNKAINAGVQEDRFKKIVKELQLKNEYKLRIIGLGLALKSKNLKKADELIYEIKKKFKDKDITQYEKQLENIKKEKTFLYLKIGGIAGGVFVIVIIIVLAISKAQKKSKKGTAEKEVQRFKGSKVQGSITEEAEEKEAEEKEEEKIEEKPEEITTENAEKKEEEVGGNKEMDNGQLTIDKEKKKIESERLEVSEEVGSEEVGSEEVGSKEKTEDRGSRLEVGEEGKTEEEKIEEKPEEVTTENAPFGHSEASAEESTTAEEAEKKNKEKKKVLIEYLQILKIDDPEREKEFISQYKNDTNIINMLKVFHLYKKGKFNSLVNEFKKLNIEENKWWMEKIINGIEKEDIDTMTEIGMCYIYYKKIGNTEKEKHYFELGRKMSDEKST
jgi:tetratricopeptide (TPR) repeat protein